MDLSIVIPTFSEPGVGGLIERIDALMTAAGITCEVIVVDDSPGAGTRDAVNAVATACQVSVLYRPDTARGSRGGLSGAVLDGAGAARAPRVLVMDGDGQHPPETIPALVAALDGADLAIASRYTRSGDAAGLADGYRRTVSSASTLLARGAFPRRVGARTTDPMTGFFALRRSELDIAAADEHAIGFKVLLAILVTHPWLRVVELPFVFGTREAGASKAGWRTGTALVRQIIRLRLMTGCR